MTIRVQQRIHRLNSYSVPADGIDKIRVEWVSGLVRVQPYEGTDIKLDEMSNDNISEEYALRYKIADGKLTVRFCKKHTWYGVDAAMLNLDRNNKAEGACCKRAAGHAGVR